MRGSLALAEAHGEDALAARIRAGMAAAQRAGGRGRADEEEDADKPEAQTGRTWLHTKKSKHLMSMSSWRACQETSRGNV